MLFRSDQRVVGKIDEPGVDGTTIDVSGTDAEATKVCSNAARKEHNYWLTNMKLLLGDLRLMIGETLRRGSGIRLIRAGGLSPVKQKNNPRAPEKWGVWAFIWPYSEMFLLGSTCPEGICSGEPKSRYHQLKREGWRKFIHHGDVYTHIPVPGAPIVGEWYKTDGSTLDAYMTKHYANTMKLMRQWERDFGYTGPVTDRNPWSLFSKDEFEVFVPRPDEKGF